MLIVILRRFFVRIKDSNRVAFGYFRRSSFQRLPADTATIALLRKVQSLSTATVQILDRDTTSLFGIDAVFFRQHHHDIARPVVRLERFEDRFLKWRFVLEVLEQLPPPVQAMR